MASSEIFSPPEMMTLSARPSTFSIRSGPSTRFKVVGKSERYDLLRTRGSDAGWVMTQPAHWKIPVLPPKPVRPLR